MGIRLVARVGGILLTDVERYKQLMAIQVKEPFATRYEISDSHFNFLMRKFQENMDLLKNNRELRKTNRDLEEQMERVQSILGTETFL